MTGPGLVSDELDHWEARLKAHFLELRDQRNRGPENRPIFGLEHGLEIGERHSLATILRSVVKKSPPLKRHYLCWVAYASEIGYRYSGDEYWQTFEEETPGWDVHGARPWI